MNKQELEHIENCSESILGCCVKWELYKKLRNAEDLSSVLSTIWLFDSMETEEVEEEIKKHGIEKVESWFYG